METLAVRKLLRTVTTSPASLQSLRQNEKHTTEAAEKETEYKMCRREPNPIIRFFLINPNDLGVSGPFFEVSLSYPIRDKSFNLMDPQRDNSCFPLSWALKRKILGWQLYVEVQ